MEDSNRLNKIIDDIKFSLEETLTRLEDIWANIGLKDEQRDERYETINTHIQDLLHEMLSEEYALEAKLEVKINEYEKELEQLCSDLGEELPTRVDGMKLAEMEAKLRNDVDILNKKKYDRVKCLRRLRDDEIELCQFLVMPQIDITLVGCPTPQQLQELEQHIVLLKQERVARTESFEKLRRGITTSWSQMEIGPDSESEYELLSGDVKCISKDYLEDLAVLHVKLNEDYVEILKDIEVKRQTFVLLWRTLKDQVDFSDAVPIEDVPRENNVHTLRILNSNIDKLNVVKKQHLEKIINAVQDELADVWDKCFFGNNQRKMFLSSYQGEYTEESLEYYELELGKMKQHFEANKELFKLVAKREALWKEKVELEKNPTDYLLNTRGGASLKALSKKNRIAKTLPKLESELQNRIKVWELQNSKCFMFHDLTYMDHLKEQKAEYEMEEKHKKGVREEVKKKEMDTGKKSKRKALTHTLTPTPTKQKFARMDVNSLKKGNSCAMRNDNKIQPSIPTCVKRPTPRPNLGERKPIGCAKAGTKINAITHSSLKLNSENRFKKKKKTLDVKLTTEWSKKQRLSRRSIVRGGVLKEKSMNFKIGSESDGQDGRLFSDDELADEIGSDDVPLSSSSVRSPDSLGDSPGISVIACDDDVHIVVHCS